MNLTELLDWIALYDIWIYGILMAYCLGKTGPLPMLAGYAASQGALRLEALLMVAALGSFAGGQIRFAVGRYASPWVYRKLSRWAHWISLASAGVERYSLRVLLTYRFVKGAFSLVGMGAGASLLSWRRYLLIDGAGAILWISALVSIGWSFGKLGAVLDPRWAAYAGLTLLVLSIATITIFGNRLKQRLLPLAEQISKERDRQKNVRLWV